MIMKFISIMQGAFSLFACTNTAKTKKPVLSGFGNAICKDRGETARIQAKKPLRKEGICASLKF